MQGVEMIGILGMGKSTFSKLPTLSYGKRRSVPSCAHAMTHINPLKGAKSGEITVSSWEKSTDLSLWDGVRSL
jgi:hypothetical protein